MANKMEKARIHSDCSSVVILRKEMNVGSDKLVRIPVGEIVKAKKQDNEWSCVQFDKKKGYVMNQFLVYGEE